MATELIALQAVAGEPAMNPLARPSSVEAGYNPSLADIARFEAAYRGSPSGAAGAGSSAAAMPANGTATATPATAQASILDSPALRAFLGPLDRINLDANRLADETRSLASKGELSPGQMIMLTVRCHEFLFHCEMTSNVANRTSDGVQQLFRQQT